MGLIDIIRSQSSGSVTTSRTGITSLYRPSGNTTQSAASAFYERVSNRQSSPVERFELSKMLDQAAGGGVGILGYAATAPGRILETPVAMAAEGIRRATGGQAGGGGGFDIFNALGSIGRGGPVSVEGIMGGLSSAVNWIGNLGAAAINSQDAAAWRAMGNRSPDSEVPGEFTEGPPILGALLPFLGRPKTVAEFRAELNARGFSDQDLDDIQSGRADIWDFGDRMVNDSVAVDLATRVAFDPFNLLFLTPLAPMRAGGMAARLWGGKTHKALVEAGHRAKVPEDLVTQQRRIASGDASQASVGAINRNHQANMLDYKVRMFEQYPDLFTKAGLIQGVGKTAKFLLDPRGYLTPKGYLRRSAVLYGIGAAQANLLPDDGFLASLKQFNQDMLARQPFSGNSAFVLATALYTPVIPELAGAAQGARMLAVKSRFMEDAPTAIKDRFGMEPDELFAKMRGGKEGFEQLAFGFGADILRRRGLHNPELLGIQDNMQQMARGNVDLYGPALRTSVTNAFRSGEITVKDIVDEWVMRLEQPHMFVDDVDLLTQAGEVVKVKGAQPGFIWDADLAIVQANMFLEAVAPLRDGMRSSSEYALGLRGISTKEEIAFLRDWAEKNLPEKMTVREVQEFLVRNPNLAMSVLRDEWAALSGRRPDFATDTTPAPISRQEVIDLLTKQENNRATPYASEYFIDDVLYEINSALNTPPRSPTAVTDIRRSLEIAKMPDGSIRPGLENAYEQLSRRFNEALAFRVKAGVQRHLSTKQNTERTFLAELKHAESNPALADEAGRIQAALVKLAGGDLDTVPNAADFIKFMDAYDKGMVDMGIPVPFADPRVGDVASWQIEKVNQINGVLADQRSPYTVVKAPKGGYVVKQGDSLPELMWQQKNLMARWLFDNSYLSPVPRFIRFLLSPVKGERMNRDAINEFHRDMVGKGFKVDDVDGLLRAAREHAESAFIVDRERGWRAFTSIDSLTRGTWDRIGEKMFAEGNPIGHAKILADGGYAAIIDRANSRLLRKLRKNVEMKPNGRLNRVLFSKYWNYRSGHMLGDPKNLGLGMAQVAGTVKSTQTGARMVSNTLYHVFRFMSDIRWYAMNKYEHIIMGTTMEGMRNGRIRSAVPDADDAARMMDPVDQGWKHYNRVLAARVARTYDAQRPSTTLNLIEELWDSDPVILGYRRDFPDADPRTLAQRLEEDMYGIDTDGAPNYISKKYREQLAAETGRSEWDVLVDQANMQPIVQRLAELHKGTHDSIVKAMVGDPDRSNLERLLNSYWLYWPISYQLKASRWLGRVLFYRAFGNQTNLLGAWKYSQMKEYFYQQMESNPDFKQEMEDNEHLWRTAAMMFPITPEDIGVSLNRGLRVAGGGLGIFDPYFESRDPFAWIVYAMNIGPVYTMDLLERLGKTFFPEPVGPAASTEPEAQPLIRTVFSRQEPAIQLDVGAPISGGDLALAAEAPVENPYDTQTYDEGGEYLPQDEYEALLEARREFDRQKNG